MHSEIQTTANIVLVGIYSLFPSKNSLQHFLCLFIFTCIFNSSQLCLLYGIFYFCLQHGITHFSFIVKIRSSKIKESGVGVISIYYLLLAIIFSTIALVKSFSHSTLEHLPLFFLSNICPSAVPINGSLFSMCNFSYSAL